MNTFNQRLLAGAAGLLAAGGALAADLPSRKSAPVEYVKVCDVYGRGFFYIPGTDTCLKIGGRVRAQYSYIGKGNAFSTTSHSVSGGAGATTPGTMNMTSANGRDQLGWYARGHLRMDARTQSAWGTVQTVIDMRVESRSGHLGNGFNTFVQTNQVNPTLVAAYIRFAGFTFGRADQNFVFMPSGIWGSKFHGDYSSGVKQLAYTATFGGGFSATIALEDMRDYEYDRIGNLGGITGGAFERGGVRGTNGPSRLPSLVGNLRLDQGWGTIQAMGAVMQQTANLTAPNAFMISNNNGPLVTKTAYAAGLGVKINLPMLAKGDALWVTGGYAKGAIGMLMEEFASAPGSKGNLAGLQRRDTGMTLYGVGGTAAAGPLAIASELTQAWQIAAMLRHYWTPSLRSHFHVSYVAITPGTQTQNTDWTKGGLSKAKAFATTANLIWSPVSGFDIGVELGYLRLRQNLTGDNGGAPSALPAVAIANGFKTNVNGWEGRLRIQRDF